MKATRTKIHVHHEMLTCKVDGKIAKFSLTKAAKFPQDPKLVATKDDFKPLFERMIE